MADVRRATAADIPTLIAMGRAMHAESPRYRGKAFSERKLVALAERINGTLMGGADDAVILVAESAGEIVGMFVAFVAEFFFSEDRFATDLLVYVKPERRGSSAFVRLVRAFEAWCGQMGIAEKVIGVSTEIHAERTVHTYEKLGYRLSGHAMVKHGN